MRSLGSPSCSQGARALRAARPPGMVKTFSCSAEKPDAVTMESAARMSSCVVGLNGCSQGGTWEAAAAGEGAASLAAASCVALGGGGLVGERSESFAFAGVASRTLPRSGCSSSAAWPIPPLLGCCAARGRCGRRAPGKWGLVLAWPLRAREG